MCVTRSWIDSVPRKPPVSPEIFVHTCLSQGIVSTGPAHSAGSFFWWTFRIFYVIL